MTYDVTLRFRISDGFLGYSSNDVWMEQSLELPFPPFIGLSFAHVDFTIDEVVWDPEAQRFDAYGPCDEQMAELVREQDARAALGVSTNVEKHQARREARFQELIDEYVAEGWTPKSP